MGDMTPLYMPKDKYAEILSDLRDHYGMKSILQSWKKQELGWTPCLMNPQGYRDVIRIDFWDPNAKSLFLLAYSHLLST